METIQIFKTAALKRKVKYVCISWSHIYRTGNAVLFESYSITTMQITGIDHHDWILSGDR